MAKLKTPLGLDLTKQQPFTTGDGSDSLRSDHFNDTYHSVHGALSESTHVYIEAGLRHFMQTYRPKTVRILEYGFGTGLNAALAWEAATRLSDCTVDYRTLEGYPIDISVAMSLNYVHLLPDIDFLALHTLDWDRSHSLADNFTFEKKRVLFEDYCQPKSYDVIFYDAFGPSAQPQHWETAQLSSVVANLDRPGCLVTFCAKGSFRRGLQRQGLTIEKLAGPPGKREMTRAFQL